MEPLAHCAPAETHGQPGDTRLQKETRDSLDAGKEGTKGHSQDQTNTKLHTLFPVDQVPDAGTSARQGEPLRLLPVAPGNRAVCGHPEWKHMGFSLS